MIAIVAVDNNWAIGYKGKLLASIPNDHKRFREITSGNVVILGRKTLETFPGGLPLKNRVNIIMSRDKNFKVKDALVVNSVEELKERVKDYSQEIFVIGGDSVYRQLLPFCDRALVTHIDYEYTADSYFPDLSKEAGWRLKDRSEEMTCFDIEYTFEDWVREGPET
ncbi:MAG: dihydrofolate reductase [Lachnospiraceae bacterium]|nr:dihydrofolate reductase [Lachnospiraceae bacterium]